MTNTDQCRELTPQERDTDRRDGTGGKSMEMVTACFVYNMKSTTTSTDHHLSVQNSHHKGHFRKEGARKIDGDGDSTLYVHDICQGEFDCYLCAHLFGWPANPIGFTFVCLVTDSPSSKDDCNLE
ncbi:hypothetical protein ACOMHN_058255 [Nucella lapillus]